MIPAHGSPNRESQHSYGPHPSIQIPAASSVSHASAKSKRAWFASSKKDEKIPARCHHKGSKYFQKRDAAVLIPSKKESSRIDSCGDRERKSKPAKRKLYSDISLKRSILNWFIQQQCNANNRKKHLQEKIDQQKMSKHAKEDHLKYLASIDYENACVPVYSEDVFLRDFPTVPLSTLRDYYKKIGLDHQSVDVFEAKDKIESWFNTNFETSSNDDEDQNTRYLTYDEERTFVSFVMRLAESATAIDQVKFRELINVWLAQRHPDLAQAEISENIVRNLLFENQHLLKLMMPSSLDTFRAANASVKTWTSEFIKFDSYVRRLDEEQKIPKKWKNDEEKVGFGNFPSANVYNGDEISRDPTKQVSKVITPKLQAGKQRQFQKSVYGDGPFLKRPVNGRRRARLK